MKNLLGMIMVVLMLMLSNIANATVYYIDSTFTDVNTSLVVGDTVFSQVINDNDGDYTGDFYALIETNNVETGEITLRFNIYNGYDITLKLYDFENSEYIELDLEDIDGDFDENVTAYVDTMVYKYNELKSIFLKLTTNATTNLDIDLTFESTEDWADNHFSSSPNNNTICEDAPVEFTSTSPANGSTLKWQVNTGSGFVDIDDNATYSGTNTATLSVNQSPYTMNGYTYRNTSVLTDNSTVNSGEAVLAINPKPETGAINGNPNPSAYETLTYMVTNTTGSTYAWEVTGGTVAADNGNSIDIMWGADGFGSLCVTETPTNGCLGDEVCLSVNVGIENITTNSFGIYPNPSKGIVVIASEAWQSQEKTIEIINIAGKTIKTLSSTTNNVEIDLSQEPKGIYFVKVSTAKAVTTQKLVIE